MRNLATALATGVCIVAMATPTYAQAAEYQISAGSLKAALDTFAKRTGSQVIYRSEEVRGVRSPGVKGSMTADEALARILAGTGFKARRDGSGAFAIVRDELATAPTSSSSSAQLDEDTVSAGEIIVTASRRDERLRDVASSVTAIGEGQLLDLSASSLNDFVGQIPNINFTGDGPSNRQLILRGVSTSTFSQVATVATYIDDVTVGSSTALAVGSRLKPDLNTFDLERIEVLRGPQDTQYGANSLGGLLKYVTKSPSTLETTFDARLDLNNVSHGETGYGIEAAVNVPVSDQAAFRLSAFSRLEGGYINNVATGEDGVNEVKSTGARLAFRAEPSDKLTIEAVAMFQNVDAGGSSTVEIDPATLDPIYGDFEQERFAPEELKNDFRLLSGTIEYDFGPVALISTTAYNEVEVESTRDWTRIEGGEFSGFPGVVSFPDKANTKTKKWSQEFKIRSQSNELLEWAAGVYLTGEESFLRTLEQGLLADGTVSTDEPTWGGGGFTTGTAENIFSTDWVSKYREVAFFGEVTVHLADNFDVTGGLRYGRNKTDFDQTFGGLYQCSTFDANVPTQCDANNEQVFPHVRSKDNATTFMVTPRWHISDSTMLYGRVAQGFRPGGPNSLAPSAIAAGAETVYRSDTLTNYEVGVKTVLFDNRVLFDLTAFYIDWEDIQIRQIVGGFAYTGNGGEASSKGIEMAVTARPTDDLSISFNLGTLDAKLDSDAPGVGGVAGDKMPNAPDLTYGGTINYDFPAFSNGYIASIGGSWRFVDDRLGDFSAGDRFEVEGYHTFDLYATLSSDRFTFRAYAKNITDKRGVEGILPFFNYAVVSRPRTIGLSLTTGF